MSRSFEDYIDCRLAAGLDSYADLAETVVEIADDDGVPEAEAMAVLAERWDARIASQSTWPAESDSDRLDAAFAELETLGVAARMNFSCCGTCAPGELATDVRHDATKTGYVYFHSQDSDQLADGSVYLGYGSLGNFFGFGGEWDDAGYDAAAAAVAHQVVAVIARHGLHVEWDGSLNRRILVDQLDWKRRLPPRPAS